jgi:diguanylate cyclase (GGDEF)-like protein
MMEDGLNPMQGRMTEPVAFLPLSEEAFTSLLEHECKRAERYSYFFALLMVRMETSDSVDSSLFTVAKLIRNMIRSSDMVCLLQSKDLAVILHEADVQNSTHILDRIRQKIQSQLPYSPTDSKGQSLKISLACFPTHASTVTDLLQWSRGGV